jgi:hypothetical protein
MKLAARYQVLYRLQTQAAESEETDYGTEMDQLFRQIVDAPIRTVDDAAEKLSLMRHCLLVEEDYVEAAHLLDQVCAALVTRNPGLGFDGDGASV